MSRPVTVLVTCFNEGAFAIAAIDSVLKQSARADIHRIIVVDDGSSDDTGELLDACAKKNPLVQVEHIANRGVSGARNHGLQLVKTPFVAFLDGDDLWHPSKLARQLEVIGRSSGRAAMWFTGFAEFDEDERAPRTPARVHHYAEDEPDTLERFFVLDGPIIPSSAVLRTKALQDAEGFCESIRLFEDMDLWLNLASRGHSFQHLPDTLVFKRRRGNSLSARVDHWNEWIGHIETRWVERRPELQRLVPRRRAVRSGRLAQACFSRGTDAQAWRYLKTAFRNDPFVIDNYVFGFLGVLPRSLRAPATTILARTRHSVTRARNGSRSEP